MASLSAEDYELLKKVVAKNAPQLMSLIEGADDLTRDQAVDLVSLIGYELTGVDAEEDWSEDSYGTHLERLLDMMNSHRMP